MVGNMPNAAQFIAAAASLPFVVALLDAAQSDLRRFHIANRVPLLLLAGFVPVALVEGFSWQEWLTHAGTGFTLLAAGILLFALKLWGGGDAKMLGTVALWIGLSGLSRFLLVMAMAGCALAVIALLIRRLPHRQAGWRGRLARTNQVPYGLAIAIAGFDWWISAAWQ